ncbi:MAG: hypothetical protein ABR567_02435, partial [Myxococcales bacterium]
PAPAPAPAPGVVETEKIQEEEQTAAEGSAAHLVLVSSESRSKKKGKPAPAEQLERQQLREYWDAEFRKRCPNEKPLEWGAEKGKRHTLVIGLLKLCDGLERAKAHLNRYFARYDVDQFHRGKGLRFDVAASAACVEELRSAKPGKHGWQPRVGTAERFKGIVPASPRSAFIREEIQEVRKHGDAEKIKKLEADLEKALADEAKEFEPRTPEAQRAQMRRELDDLRDSITKKKKERERMNPHIQQFKTLSAEIDRLMVRANELAGILDSTLPRGGASIHITERAKNEVLTPGRKFLSP